ncbi:MAG TPA: S8 family serine peptidase [Armatimonadota bacterium]|jgi:thermitase
MKKLQPFVRCLSALAVAVSLVSALVAPHPARAQRSTEGTIVPGEILVGMRPTADVPGRSARIVEALGIGAEQGHSFTLHVGRVRLGARISASQAMSRLRMAPGVEFVEPNHYLHAFVQPNDPYFAQQYAPRKTQADSAWSVWKPLRRAIIAIVDTGVDSTHPDLKDKILRGGNGQVIGYNALTGRFGDAKDDYGHGTHCAGIAAAQVNNRTGVAGIAGWTGSGSDSYWTKIMPIKALDRNGQGSDASVADGIATAAHLGANVISLSLGGPNPSSTLQRAVDFAWNAHDCVVVAAAGNSWDSSRQYPAACTNVLSVAATDATDTLAPYSTFGSWVATAAPGDSIVSTMPTYHCTLNDYGYPSNYATLSGTSMACPLVAGEAALLWSENVTGNGHVTGWILRNTDPYRPYWGRIGGGRVNVLRAVRAALP